MKEDCDNLSLRRPDDRKRRLESIIDFWNGVSCLEAAGETTWGVVEEIQAQVSNCLSREPIDLKTAESLTAKAGLLMSGRHLF